MAELEHYVLLSAHPGTPEAAQAATLLDAVRASPDAAAHGARLLASAHAGVRLFGVSLLETAAARSAAAGLALRDALLRVAVADPEAFVARKALSALATVARGGQWPSFVGDLHRALALGDDPRAFLAVVGEAAMAADTHDVPGVLAVCEAAIAAPEALACAAALVNRAAPTAAFVAAFARLVEAGDAPPEAAELFAALIKSKRAVPPLPLRLLPAVAREHGAAGARAAAAAADRWPAAAGVAEAAVAAVQAGADGCGAAALALARAMRKGAVGVDAAPHLVAALAQAGGPAPALVAFYRLFPVGVAAAVAGLGATPAALALTLALAREDVAPVRELACGLLTACFGASSGSGEEWLLDAHALGVVLAGESESDDIAAALRAALLGPCGLRAAEAAVRESAAAALREVGVAGDDVGALLSGAPALDDVLSWRGRLCLFEGVAKRDPVRAASPIAAELGAVGEGGERALQALATLARRLPVEEQLGALRALAGLAPDPDTDLGAVLHALYTDLPEETVQVAAKVAPGLVGELVGRSGVAVGLAVGA